MTWTTLNWCRISSNSLVLALFEQFPDIANDLQLISGLCTTTNSRYLLFLKIMAEPLVGSTIWKACFLNEQTNINEVLTSSNEAFLLLCCENYHQKWLSASVDNAQESSNMKVCCCCCPEWIWHTDYLFDDFVVKICCQNQRHLCQWLQWMVDRRTATIQSVASSCGSW